MTDAEYSTLDGPRLPREPDEHEIHIEARARFLKRLVVGFLAALLTFVVGGMGFTVYQIRAAQVANHTTLTEAKAASASSAATAKRIESCTTPGEKCYDDAQRNSSGAIAGINTVTVRATACLAALINKLPAEETLTANEFAIKIRTCVVHGTVNVAPTRITSAPESVVRPKAPSPTRRFTSSPHKKHHGKAKGHAKKRAPVPLAALVCKSVPLCNQLLTQGIVRF